MSRYEQLLADLGDAATLRQIRILAARAEKAGQTWDLGMALVSIWNFETANPLASDRVLRLLVRAGLRREAIRMVGNAEFPGKAGCLLRLEQLLPTALDRGDGTP